MKRMLRVSLGALLALVMLVGLVGAAGAEGQVTLNALFMKQAGYSEDDCNAIIAAFEAANPDIKVVPTYMAYEDLETKILATANSGGFDIVPGDCIWTAQFAQAGLAKDLTDKVSGIELADVWPGSIDAITYQGKYYGLPWLNDVKYLFYNKQMIKDAGFENPPATWDELVTQATAIKEKGLCEYPLVWCWAQAECLICDYTAISGGFGGAFVDKDNNPTLDTPENKAALDFMVSTLQNGLTNPNSLEMTEDNVLSTFCAGDAAFALNWTYMFASAQDEKVSSQVGNVGICLIPGTTDVRSATVNGGMSLMMTSGTKYPEEAWKFMDFAASKDIQKTYSKSALPIWKSLFSDQTVIDTSPEVVAIAAEQYGYLVNRPMVPYYSQLSVAMQSEIQNVLLGNQTSADALKNIQTKALELQAQ